MGKRLAYLLMKLAGWTIKGHYPPTLNKSVMIGAPHTSNWDFVLTRLSFYAMGVPLRFTIKKEWLKPPIGWFIKAIGGLGIDRKKSGGAVQGMVQLFKDHKRLCIVVTPEGTRKYAPKWKTGFYYVALEAGVPIMLGYLDYGKKEAGIGPTVVPSGNLEEDLETIQAFYRTITPLYPDQGVK